MRIKVLSKTRWIKYAAGPVTEFGETYVLFNDGIRVYPTPDTFKAVVAALLSCRRNAKSQPVATCMFVEEGFFTRVVCVYDYTPRDATGIGVEFAFRSWGDRLDVVKNAGPYRLVYRDDHWVAEQEHLRSDGKLTR